MFNEFYTGEPDIAFTVEEPWTLWEIEELNLVVAGLNSTMRESHRDQDHYGWVGERQLRWFAERLEHYVQRGWFRLGVVHHNTIRGPVADDENLRDAEQLAELLAGPLNLLLHGHTHDSKITWLGQASLPVLSTGSAALSSASRPFEVPNQYQLIRLHAGGIERWTRRYEPSQRRWSGDTSISSDGQNWHVKHQLSFMSAHRTFATATAEIAGLTDLAQSRDDQVGRAHGVSHRPQVTSPRRVFLCHSSTDKARVRTLYHRLLDDGFVAWLDEEDLMPGENWELAIRNAIRASDYVVVCLSSASTTRAGYAQREIKEALDVADEQPEGAIFVIPARLEDCKVPDRLSHLHWVDLFASEGYRRLTRVLRTNAFRSP